MNRYAAKEDYLHTRWTVERRRGHLYSVLFAENADVLDGRDVLMLGCNTGTTLALLAERGRATGLDINADAVDLARIEGLQAVVGSVLEMPFACGTFDTIVALDIIEHVYPFDVARLVDECHRVLRAGGSVLGFTPRTDAENPSMSAMDEAHVQWFTTAEQFAEQWRRRFAVEQLERETRANPGDGARHDAWFMRLRRT